jgi:hypothetical protein
MFAFALTHLLSLDAETHLIGFHCRSFGHYTDGKTMSLTPVEYTMSADTFDSGNVANQCFFVDCESDVFAIGLTHLLFLDDETHLIEFDLYGLSVFRSLHRWKSNVTYHLLRPVEYTMSADTFETNVLPAQCCKSILLRRLRKRCVRYFVEEDRRKDHAAAVHHDDAREA